MPTNIPLALFEREENDEKAVAKRPQVRKEEHFFFFFKNGGESSTGEYVFACFSSRHPKVGSGAWLNLESRAKTNGGK